MIIRRHIESLRAEFPGWTIIGDPGRFLLVRPPAVGTDLGPFSRRFRELTTPKARKSKGRT